jgi:hypothetical protein
MYLLKIVNIHNEIERYRKEMKELVMYKGMNDPEVLNIRMKIDQLINTF